MTSPTPPNWTVEWYFDYDNPIILISHKRGQLSLSEEEAKSLRDQLSELLKSGPEDN